MPFIMQSNTLVPGTDTMLSPVMKKEEKNTKSIITLENADLQVQTDIKQEETDEKISMI